MEPHDCMYHQKLSKLCIGKILLAPLTNTYIFIIKENENL